MIFKVNDFICKDCSKKRNCRKDCGCIMEVISEPGSKEKAYKVLFGKTRIEVLKANEMRMLSYSIN